MRLCLQENSGYIYNDPGSHYRLLNVHNVTPEDAGLQSELGQSECSFSPSDVGLAIYCFTDFEKQNR